MRNDLHSILEYFPSGQFLNSSAICQLIVHAWTARVLPYKYSLQKYKRASLETLEPRLGHPLYLSPISSHHLLSFSHPKTLTTDLGDFLKRKTQINPWKTPENRLRKITLGTHEKPKEQRNQKEPDSKHQQRTYTTMSFFLLISLFIF